MAANEQVSTGVRLVRVPEDRDGQRLDNFLLLQLKGAPRSLVYKLVRSGQVRINGKRAKADTRLAGGDEVRIPPVRLGEPGEAAAPPKALLDRHFREHRPVQSYADTMGLTAGQLSRICREVLGMSSLDVINARLLHEAQRDLVYTSSSIKQLAGELGFEDDAYFSRFFKRHTGLSPREFRAQALAQLAGAPAPD